MMINLWYRLRVLPVCTRYAAWLSIESTWVGVDLGPHRLVISLGFDVSGVSESVMLPIYCPGFADRLFGASNNGSKAKVMSLGALVVGECARGRADVYHGIFLWLLDQLSEYAQS